VKGKLVGLGVAVIALAWVYTTFLQGAELRGMLPAWAGGPERAETVEEAAGAYAEAFGYRGSDGGDFRARIDGAVTEGYYGSPAGREVEETARWLDEHEETWEQTVELVDFRITRPGEEEAQGLARYRTSDRIDGEDAGGGTAEQEIRFVREGGGWSAAWASDSRRVQEEQPTQTAEPTVSEPSGGPETVPGASTGPTMGELRGEEEDARIEEAVRNFNDAYDFEGTSADAYTAQIEPYVTDDFWSSPRGSQNLASIEEIEASGETFVQDAELVAWEPTRVGVREASGYATRSFTSSVGDEPGSYTIRHELRLVEEDGEWKVAWAGDDLEGS
jgi:hypothetical protein